MHRLAPEPQSRYPSPYTLDPLFDSFDDLDTSEALQRACRVVVNLKQPKVGWRKDVAYAIWYRDDHIQPSVADGPFCTIPVCMATRVGSHGQITWDNLVATRRHTKRGQAPPLKERRAIEVYREGDGEHANFFLVWEKIDQVKVNGKLCASKDKKGSEIAVGPLPDFAIVEAEETIIFWFRNEEALGYLLPESTIAKPAVTDAEILGEEPGEEPSAEQPKEAARNQRRTWKDIMQEGLSKHRLEHAKDPEKPEFAHIGATSMLELDSVVLAIGSVWQGLAERGHLFAYNETVHFYQARFLRRVGDPIIRAAVYRPNDLVIPMLLDNHNVSPPNSARPTSPPVSQEEREKRPKKPHILLGVAQDKGDGTVNTIVMDSFPGYHHPGRIRGSIRKTVLDIGWISMDQHGDAVRLEKEPDWTDEVREVPAQEGVDTCGIYTILNAWVYMLELPALNGRARLPDAERGDDDAEEFLQGALEIINLALSGHMDLGTIQAFLNYFGYCQLQEPEGDGIRLGPDRTARMDDRRLEEFMTVRRYEELRDIRNVIKGTGCSHDRSLECLRIAGWDVDQAIEYHRAESAIG